MPGIKAVCVTLTLKQKKILDEFSRGTHTSLHLKQRATIVLMANNGETNNEIARRLHLTNDCVVKWRGRYSQAFDELAKTETGKPLSLRKVIISILSDKPRSGAPARITQEQVAAIIALSSEEPTKLRLPFSHWTPSLLRQVVIEKGIVTEVSVRQIGRFFKICPSQSQ